MRGSLLLLAGLAVLGCQVPQPEHRPEEYDIAATQLSTEYYFNEVKADLRYRDQILRIQGKVDTIGKDLLGELYVTLYTYRFFSVQCLFPKAAERDLAQLQSGESIVIQGRITGKLGNILVKDCRISSR